MSASPVAGSTIDRARIRFCLYLLGFFLFFVGWWMRRYFGELTIDQFLFHISFGSEGLVESDNTYVYRFIKWCLALPLLVTLLVLRIEKAAFFQAFKSRASTSPRVKRWMLSKFPVLLIIFSAVSLIHQVSLIAYLTNDYREDYFTPHYIAPASVELKKKTPKNLVLIYVESLEASYRNEKVFGRNLLARLDAVEGVGFTRFVQAPGTNWTIAGIVASQCGIPLKTFMVFERNQQGEAIKSFLPGAVCLGDILSDMGYRNVFLGGASLTFAGKGKFFAAHNFHEAHGKENWISEGHDPAGMNKWGLHDDDLFAVARRRLKELHDSKQPFNLTMLTLDTHFPTGFVSKECAQRGVKDMTGIVECVAGQVAEFVEFVRKSGYLADTNVVVIGDHLSMPNSLDPQLAEITDRTLFNLFISERKPVKNREEVLHFDMLPTILEFIGVDVPGDRLGLGYSAFGEPVAVPPADRFNKMESSLMNNSPAYMELWKPRKPRE